MTEELFEDPNKPKAPDHVGDPPPADQLYDHLVGEGKKFSDREALAKAKVESDNFIQRLQNENEGLRQDLSSRLTLEEFMEKLNEREQTTPSSSSQEPNVSERGDQTTNSLSMEDVSSFFEQEYSRRTTEQKHQSNVNTCIEEAKKAYGPNYKSELTKRAGELEMDQKELSAMAATQPKVFLRLMVEDAPPRANFTPPPSSDRTSESFEPITPTLTRKSQFDEVRRKDPDRYWDRNFQNQMHKVAQREGPDFFDT